MILKVNNLDICKKMSYISRPTEHFVECTYPGVMSMTFAADTSNCYWVRAHYKIKIGLVRPQIYLIFFTALRLSRSGQKITIINSLGPLQQSSPLSHSTSASAIEGLTKVTTVHARILSNRVCFLRFFGVFSAAKGYTFTNFLDRLPRTYVLLSRAGET